MSASQSIVVHRDVIEAQEPVLPCRSSPLSTASPSHRPLAPTVSLQTWRIRKRPFRRGVGKVCPSQARNGATTERHRSTTVRGAAVRNMHVPLARSHPVHSAAASDSMLYSDYERHVFPDVWILQMRGMASRDCSVHSSGTTRKLRQPQSYARKPHHHHLHSSPDPQVDHFSATVGLTIISCCRAK